MERIKEALERAREERAGAGSSGGQPRARSDASRPVAVAPDEIEYTQTRVIPLDSARLVERRIVAHLPAHPAADAYRVLRTQVLRRMTDNGWSTLMVTSPTEGNGKTLTAINLAISMAREVNHTVLLVDFDLRRPTIGGFFSDAPMPGISDHLLHRQPLSEMLFNPSIERLMVLPGHEALADSSSERLSSPQVVELVEEIKNRYPARIIIFDLPPLLQFDDVLAFSPYVDAALLVVEEGATTDLQLRRSHELLQNVNLCGVVLNKSREESSAYGSGYGYAHG